MDDGYDGPGGGRRRRQTERCDRKPGRERLLQGNQISERELLVRLLAEMSHDPEVKLHLDPTVLDRLAAEHAGRCHECGRRIGLVDVCRYCNAVQTAVWKRHVDKRKVRKTKT